MTTNERILKYRELKNKVNQLSLNDRKPFEEDLQSLQKIIKTNVKYGDIFKSTILQVHNRFEKLKVEERGEVKRYARILYYHAYDPLYETFKKSCSKFKEVYNFFSKFFVIKRSVIDDFKRTKDTETFKNRLKVLIFPFYVNYLDEFKEFDIIDENKREGETINDFIFETEHVLLKLYRFYILHLLQMKLFREYFLFYIYNDYLFVYAEIKVHGEGMLNPLTSKPFYNVVVYQYLFFEKGNIKVFEYDNNTQNLQEKRLDKTERIRITYDTYPYMAKDLFLHKFGYLSYENAAEIGFGRVFSDNSYPKFPDHLKKFKKVEAVCLHAKINRDNEGVLIIKSRCETSKLSKVTGELGFVEEWFSMNEEIILDEFYYGNDLLYKRIIKNCIENEIPSVWKIYI